MDKLSDSFIFSVIKSIKKECIFKKISIPNDQFLFTLLKLHLLNPIKPDTKKLAKSCIESILRYLSLPKFPSVATIKIQIYFTHYYTTKEDVLSKYRKIKEKTVKLSMNQILPKPKVFNREDTVQLYYDICRYIVQISEIGDVTDDELMKKTYIALKSVISPKELIRFVSKPMPIKMSQLTEITHIVTGICLYNKDGDELSDSINDFPNMLESSLQKCYGFMECKLRKSEQKLSLLIYQFLKFYSKTEVLKQYKIDEFEEESIIYLKSYIIFCQQFNIYLRILIKENGALSKAFQICFTQFKQKLSKIRKTVKFRTAIPVVEIFPQFKELSSSWAKLLEISTLLNNISDIVCFICDIFEELEEPKLDTSINNSDLERLHLYNFKQIKSDIKKGCEWIKPENDFKFYNLDIQYVGFCSVTFTETKGVLVFGIKEYGLIKHKHLFYCFASIEAMDRFCQEPEKYIQGMKKTVFLWPETIVLLNLEKYFSNLSYRDKGITNVKKLLKIDVEIQTDVHPELLYDDYEYNFKILQLQERFSKIIRTANLANYRTHSVQTNESSFRKDTSIQTDPV